MKLKISVIALAFAGAASASASQAGAGYAAPGQDPSPPHAAGAPQGSSERKPGEERYDRVGRAGFAGEGEGVFALSNLLPPGSHAEVTALDSGKTILVAVRGSGPALVDLSPDAARLLGVTGTPPVRIRRVVASPQDARLLAEGQAATPRADAPPALLAGLKRQLVDAKPVEPVRQPVRTAAPVKPKPDKAIPAAAKPVAIDRGLFVQIAALSNADRARALAAQVGGVVRSAGKLHRVQIGPYPDAAAAQRGRADIARRGHPDARIVTNP